MAIGTQRMAGVVVLLALAVNLSRADDSKVYDLRGPAPEKGQVLVNKTTFKIKNATVTIKSGETTLKAKQTLTAIGLEEIKALAVEGRQITRAQTKITKDHVETVTSLGGQETPETKAGDLEGEVVISERIGHGKWKHSLVDTKATQKQKNELAKRIGPENDDEMYPEEKVKVGHKWTVDATALQRIFGGAVTDLKGKLKLTFTRIEEVDGEPCAVIEAVGTISGVAKEDEGTLDVEMDLKGTTWRSLKTGFDVKDEAAGKLKMSGKLEMDGAKVGLTLTGPFTISSTVKLK